jgi:heat shock protein HtpX
VQAVGLRTYIWNNFWKSAALMAGFPVLLALMAFGLALIFADDRRGFSYGVQHALSMLPFFLVVACVVALGWFGVAYAANQRIIDFVTGARPVTRKEEPRLWNLLETLCISRGMTMPRLAVIETQTRNAFASGLSRETGAVTVTRGLMDGLDDRELTAVLAHELTHIRNGDARLGVIAAVFAGVISLVAEMVFRGWRPRRSSSDRGGGMAALVGLAVLALAFALAAVLRMALSRNREFLADAGAVELTQDPDAMIGALRKVAGSSDMPAVPSQVRAMFLDDALGQRFGNLLGTHPTIEARVGALVKFAGGRDPGPITAPDLPWSAEAPAPASAENPWAGAQAGTSGTPWWKGPARSGGAGSPWSPR